MKTNQLVKVLVVSAMAVCTLVAVGSFTTAQAADEGNHGQLSRGDYKFATEATHGNMAEIQLGQLAMQKASDPAVKQFAQRIVDDHSKANQQLQQILSKNGVTIPTETTSSENRELEHLQKLEGPAFDKAYIDHMVKAHKKDVKEFEKASTDAQNQDLKAFAANTLPVLQDHLRMAEDLKPSVKAEKRSE